MYAIEYPRISYQGLHSVIAVSVLILLIIRIEEPAFSSLFIPPV